MHVGADMSTVSIHKTGGSLTQTSAILLNEGLISKEKVRTIINLMQTTSASYLLLASLDLARKHLVSSGYQLWGNLLALSTKAKSEISKIPGLSVITRDDYANGKEIYDYDETKIVVRVNGLGLTGFEVYDLFKEKYHIQLELAETYVVLAVTGPGDTAEDLTLLVDAFRRLSQEYYGKRAPFHLPRTDFFVRPQTVVAPRDAFYSVKNRFPPGSLWRD